MRIRTIASQRAYIDATSAFAAGPPKKTPSASACLRISACRLASRPEPLPMWPRTSKRALASSGSLWRAAFQASSTVSRCWAVKFTVPR